MKLTSKEANKMLNNLQNELMDLKQQEHGLYVFNAATIENKEDVRPGYDFAAYQKEINDLENKIIKIKHSINSFNVNTVVPELNMTIDQLLVYLPMLSEKKNKLNRMVFIPDFERVSTGNTNIIDYSYINYDKEAVKKEYQKVVKALDDAQNALDKVNVSLTMDINL